MAEVATYQALERLYRLIAEADNALFDSWEARFLDAISQGNLGDLFKENRREVELFLTRRIPPSTFSSARFLNILDALSQVIEVAQLGETENLREYLRDTVGLTPEETASLVTGASFNSAVVRHRLLGKALSVRTQGLSLSERIWGSSKRVQDALLTQVNEGLAAGKNPKEILRDVRKAYSTVSEFNTRRLVMTESRRQWNAVQREAYSEFKHVKKVKLVFGPKHKEPCTCDPWQRKGAIPYEDMPHLPIHPFSSSYLVGVPTPPEEWKKEMGFN